MDREKINFTWWYYFWLLVVLSAISMLFLESVEDWLGFAFSLPALAGLWGYLKRRPLGHRYLWIGYFCFGVLSAVYGWLSPVDVPADFRMAIYTTAAIVFALSLPLTFALWMYAFRSSDIWGQPASAA